MLINRLSVITAFFTGTSLMLLGCSHPNMKSDDVPADQKVYSYDKDDPCYKSNECYSVPVGSKDIDTARLKPFQASWTQSMPRDGQWEISPMTIDETLSLDQAGNWVHVQKSNSGTGMAKIETRRLDKKTWQILDLTITFENAPAGQPEKVFYDLTRDEYTADITLPNGDRQAGQPRIKSIPMFDGQIAGLTLAALPLTKGYRATVPMIIPSSGLYWVEVEVVDQKLLSAEDGSEQDVWEVNTTWFNLTDGKTYGPGADEDGGVYYVAVNPDNGIPHIIEYANKGVRVTWDGTRSK